MTMQEIEKHTRAYAMACDDLGTAVRILESKLDEVREKYLGSIKHNVRQVAEKKAKLSAAIDSGRALFEKPKTVVLCGYQVGLRKGKGRLDWEDDEKVVALIEKKLPDLAEVLIQVKKKPLAKAMAELSVDDLRRIGVTAEECGDEILIKAVDSEADKIVKALMKDYVDEAAA